MEEAAGETLRDRLLIAAVCPHSAGAVVSSQSPHSAVRGAMGFDGGRHGVDGTQHTLGDFGVGDLEPVVLVQAHDELERVDRVEPETVRAKQHLVIANFLGADLKHQVVDEHPFDLRFEFLSHTRRVALE